MKRLPVLVVSGFLGAGKTSLLAHLLAQNQGLRPAVLINDPTALHLGVIPIAECLQSFPPQSTFLLKLTAGCICCSLRNEFLELVEQLAKQDFDYLLVEASGLALPGPLADAISQGARSGAPPWERVYLDAVATVIDARQFLDDQQSTLTLQEMGLADPHAALDLSEVLLAQIKGASRLVLNKIDLVQEEEALWLEGQLRQLNPGAIVLVGTHGRIDSQILLHTRSEQPSELVSDTVWQSQLRVDRPSLFLPPDLRFLRQPIAQEEPPAPEPPAQTATSSPPQAEEVIRERSEDKDLIAAADGSGLPPHLVHVDPTGKRLGSDAFVSLAAALEAVPAGGVVQVAAGTYPGGLLIDRPVHLIGDPGPGWRPGPGDNAPVIDCSRSPDGPGIVLGPAARGTTIEGFVFIGPSSPGSIGIATRGAANVRVRNNRLTGLSRALALDGSQTGGWAIENNLFTGEGKGEGTAIHLGEELGGGPIAIQGNEIARHGCAIRILSSIPIAVAGNRFDNNGAVLGLLRKANEWLVQMDGNDIEPPDGKMIEYLDRQRLQEPRLEAREKSLVEEIPEKQSLEPIALPEPLPQPVREETAAILELAPPPAPQEEAPVEEIPEPLSGPVVAAEADGEKQFSETIALPEPLSQPIREETAVIQEPAPPPAPREESPVEKMPVKQSPEPIAPPKPLPQPVRVETPASQEPAPLAPQFIAIPAAEPLLVSQGMPCLLDLRSILALPDDPKYHFILHWGDKEDRTYQREELQRLGGLLLHLYRSTGVYTVTLDLVDETGQHQNVAGWQAAVFPQQIAGPTSGLIGQSLRFSAGNTNSPSGGPPCYTWQVRDHSGQLVEQLIWTWSEPRPALTFTPHQAGWYTIVLTIQDAEGGLSKFERSLLVREGPM